MDAYTEKCVNHCLKMEYSNYEILVIPDYCDSLETINKVRILPAGPMKPMSKRLFAGSISEGPLCAFIDSDAFPTEKWLRNAVRHFEDSNIAAVAGPSFTSNDEEIMAKASGLVLASPFGGGSESIRYKRSSPYTRYVTEAPTCNLIIRKSMLQKVQDHILDVWPGEEIILCGALTNDLKKKIIHDPKVAIYHRRRPLFASHLRQIWSYGFIKGFLLKSCRRYVRLRFLAPSFLVLGISAGLIPAVFNPLSRHVYIVLLSTYLSLSVLNGFVIGLRQKSAKIGLLTFIGVIATHVCYGIAFIKGVLSKRLQL